MSHGVQLSGNEMLNRKVLRLSTHQGSYRSSIVKFPDFSSHGMTISQTLSKQ